MWRRTDGRTDGRTEVRTDDIWKASCRPASLGSGKNQEKSKLRKYLIISSSVAYLPGMMQTVAAVTHLPSLKFLLMLKTPRYSLQYSTLYTTVQYIVQ